MALLTRARNCIGGARLFWLIATGVAAGSGIWATHFVAMLAFAPAMPAAYDLSRTVLSLAIAMLVTGSGFTIAIGRRIPGAAWIGGALVGGGIAAMHYTGMSAFETAGHLSWNRALVAVSIAIGSGLGALALRIGLAAGIGRRLIGATLLVLAIVGHHFTGMAAVTILPDPTISPSVSSIPTSWLAAAVALASVLILLSAAVALALDARDRSRSMQARERLQSLANASVEGLVVCRDGVIVSVNESFCRLAGLADTATAVGQDMQTFVAACTDLSAMGQLPDEALETELRTQDGGAIPVEVIVRPIAYSRGLNHAVAIRDLRARRRAEREIHYLAHHDSLTGLSNRANFLVRLDGELKAAEAGGRKLAVLCLDLDRFKEVNDLFGHAAGDAVLQTVARVVTGVLDDDQVMARLGGDEFAIAVPCDHAVAAGRVAEAALQAMRSAGRDGPAIGGSIGVAIFPDDSRDRATLLNFADTALYRAKQEGRGTYRFFETAMGADVRERRMIEHELRHAVARRELALVYQPQSRLATNQVFGFEALLRWQHRERGAVPPSLFIPIAEESGIILQIGEWVLREACREAASWDKPLAIAVNVSPIQLHSESFVGLVHQVLLETGLPASRLEIEITETALIRDANRTLLTLRQLKALGIKIAMDDFGTGYSSLSNLKSFPFDRIKIDRSFINSVNINQQAAAIVESVLVLGEGLSLPVVAEGVETEDELRFLAERNCHAVQGYLIGRPAQIDSFAALTTDLQAEPSAIVRAA